MKVCGGSYGIFMNIRKCVILLLAEGKGTFALSPYLDIHGESDAALRRGKPQFLNWKRYGEFRKLWLSHGVPSLIARNLDQV
jgi:E3 ubiquitin-protein ligase UBR1